MMRFTIGLLLVLSILSAPAQSTNGIRVGGLPTTNSMSVTQRVVVHLPGLGTNATQTIPLGDLLTSGGFLNIGGTNQLRFTNECITTVVRGLDTNITVAVSNAGLAAVNGIYRTNLLNGFTQGIYKICFDSSYGSFVISNASQKVYGFDSLGATDIGDGITWFDDFLGNPPAPASWWGPVNVTNCFTVLAASSALALPAVSTNLYVNELGNDTNALRGRVDRPWRNVQQALFASQPGDKVIVGPGNFPTPSYLGLNYYVSNRISLIGAGRGVTTIGSAGVTEQRLLCASEVVLRDFTFIGAVRMGAQEMGITATNCLIDSCEVLGTLDIVHVQTFEGVLAINMVKGISSFDGLADFDPRLGGSNRVIRITNSELTITNRGGGNTLRVIKGNDSRIEIFNSSLSLVGFAPNLLNTIIYMDSEGVQTNHSGSVLLSNVRLYRTSTNGVALITTNFLNRTPIFFDNCTMFISTPTLVSGSYTNGWHDRQIEFPNGSVRTNWLVDVRSLTNALVAASEQGHTVRITDDLATAAGTNIFIYPLAGQTILGGPLDGAGRSYTNITVNRGSMLLQIRSNSWQVISKLP